MELTKTNKVATRTTKRRRLENKAVEIKMQTISLSHAMRPGLKIRHFWVAKLLFLMIIFL